MNKLAIPLAELVHGFSLGRFLATQAMGRRPRRWITQCVFRVADPVAAFPVAVSPLVVFPRVSAPHVVVSRVAGPPVVFPAVTEVLTPIRRNYVITVKFTSIMF